MFIELKKNKNSKAKTKIKKEVKKVEKKKIRLPKPKKTIYKPSFDFGDSLKGAIKVLAYPFILLFKLFTLIFEGRINFTFPEHKTFAEPHLMVNKLLSVNKFFTISFFRAIGYC